MAVTGSVQLDGRPVNEAIIVFVPLQAQAKKTGGVIADGKYQLSSDIGLLPGTYRVEIVDDPPHTAASNTAMRRPFPQHYSAHSPLRATVAASAANAKFDFVIKLVPDTR
ncbi:MAG: hypothetical protein IT427_11900 [Pirellulales bacterium]|nr:hypothetical protein [Pirellulales bacterium]